MSDEIFNNNLQLYDNYYDKPDWWFRFRYSTQIKKKTILHLIKAAKQSFKNKQILEIGFGSGEVLFSFDRSCSIYGLELSSSAIAKATQRAKESRFYHYEFQKSVSTTIPYADNVFDIIIASHVMEHVNNDKQLIDEIWRTLKPEGMGVFLVPINERYIDPNHIRKYTEANFISFLSNHNFNHLVDSIKNDFIFKLVERFYFEEYNKRWKILGPCIAILFNFSTFWLPFTVLRFVDHVCIKYGLQPRQFGCIVQKPLE